MTGDSPPLMLHEYWYDRAHENVEEWGLQDPAVVLLAMQEELGELTRAYLEATYEDGERDAVPEEMHDLGALLVQLHWALNEHAGAFVEVGEI